MLEKIEPPSQLISALRDPLLQKYLLLRPSDTASKRLDLFLSSILESELSIMSEGLGPSKHLQHILHSLVCHTRYMKVRVRYA